MNAGTYDLGGGKQRAHGDEYRLLLTMLFMLRAYNSNMDFEIAIQFAPAGKFRDIYVRYKNDTCDWREFYFNVKHTTKDSVEISPADLLFSKHKKKKYNMTEFLESYTLLPHDSYCFLYTNQRWHVPPIIMQEVKTRDIDECFLQHIMNPTCLRLTDTTCLNTSDIADVFIRRFHIAHAQRSLSEIRHECNEIMLAFSNQNAALAALMLDNLYGQLQDWYNDTKGTFKDNEFIRNFIESLSSNSVLYLRYCVRAPDPHVKFSPVLLNSIRNVNEMHTQPGELVDVAVVGAGGCDLVARYLLDHDSMYTHVCWIHASTDANIQHAMQQIANQLGVLHDEQEIASEIYASLQHEHKAAFVFDQALDIDHLVKYLPLQSLDNVHVFVTSSHCEWPARLHVNMKNS